MTSPESSQLPPVLLRVSFADGGYYLVDRIAFEALEAAWNLQAEQGRDRVVTVKLIHGGTASFKMSAVSDMVVSTRAQRDLNRAQLKELLAENPEEEWKE